MASKQKAVKDRGYKARDPFLNLSVAVVGAHGLLIIISTLLIQFRAAGIFRPSAITIDLPLLFGLTLLYLYTLLRRRKYTAWIVAVLVYTFMLGVNTMQLLEHSHFHRLEPLELLRNIALPAAIVILLALLKKYFVVKSDIKAFAVSLRFSVVVLLVALGYGVAGFLLMDQRDFFHEISLGEALHHTIDQLGLTTSHQLMAHTRRARVFLDSLSFISIAALAYALASLFRPLKARVSHPAHVRERAAELAKQYPVNSEDFFKFWPRDKNYFFGGTGKAAVAYKVQRGVAMVVGDPIGRRANWPALLAEFDEFCFVNDWLPAFIHIDPRFHGFYKSHGFSMQKIGEEAVVDIGQFNANLRNSKYFRQIANRFERQNFRVEVLAPPHEAAVIRRLARVSREWLARPGRTERQMMMGYFSASYMQKCRLAVLKDESGTVQAFLNLLPGPGTREATYDLLRTAESAPSNGADFLLMGFMDYLSEQGYARLNLGLCPLAGLKDSSERGVINSTLALVYSGGDRLYSFKGLTRFKAKYEPNWEERYIAYRGGLRGFTRTMTALTRAMKV